MSWLDYALPLIEAAPTIEEGVMQLFTHLHNEMKNGNGTTNPVGVVEEGLAGVGQIAQSLINNTPHASPAAAEQAHEGETEIEASDNAGDPPPPPNPDPFPAINPNPEPPVVEPS